jgi:hypothetical protein
MLGSGEVRMLAAGDHEHGISRPRTRSRHFCAVREFNPMDAFEEMLAYSTLPFSGVSTGMKNREHNDYWGFYYEVHDVRKTFEKRSTHSGSEMRILERAFNNPIVGAS